MTISDQDRRIFEALREEPSQLRRSLVTAAILTRALSAAGLQPVVVGGTAVSFYTSGTYESIDLDVVMPGLEPAAEVLVDLGFKRLGAVFTHPRVPVIVDFPPEPLEGAQALLRTTLVDAVAVRIIGVEDVLLERVFLAERESDQKAHGAALAMAVAHWEDIDWDYVRAEAASPAWGVADAVDRLLRGAQDLRRTMED